MKDGPIKVGEVAEQEVGLLYHNQVMQRFHEASQQITLNALVMLCLTARRFDHTVAYVLLDDSDQGSWQTVTGLAANLPQYAGHYSTELDRDRDDEFDDLGWASSIDDRTEDVWLPYCHVSEFLPMVKLLDVERVLNSVELPWRPAAGTLLEYVSHHPVLEHPGIAVHVGAMPDADGDRGVPNGGA